MPMFYLFRRSTEESNSSGGIWALLLGSIIALIQFFLGDLISPGGFGISRWVSGLVDIVVLPVMIPLFLYFFLVLFKIVMGTADFTNFTLLWLIPGAGIRAVSWSSANDPVLLVLVPVLWTAMAVGIPLFIRFIMVSYKWSIKIPSILAILCLPFMAATAWWAFYSQKFGLGTVFLILTLLPMAVSMIISLLKTQTEGNNI